MCIFSGGPYLPYWICYFDFQNAQKIFLRSVLSAADSFCLSDASWSRSTGLEESTCSCRRSGEASVSAELDRVWTVFCCIYSQTLGTSPLCLIKQHSCLRPWWCFVCSCMFSCATEIFVASLQPWIFYLTRLFGHKLFRKVVQERTEP